MTLTFGGDVHLVMSCSSMHGAGVVAELKIPCIEEDV